MTTVADTKNVIYGLSCTCHPGKGVRYIGKTVNSAIARLSNHRRDAIAGVERPVHFWIRKHGAENISTQILDSLPSASGLYEAEMVWIDRLEMRVSHRKGGLNLTDGGPGTTGMKFSHETRAKMSASRKLSGTTLARIESRCRKLSNDDVLQIKAGIWDGGNQSELAVKFGVHFSTIENIKNGKHWVSTPWPTNRPRFSESRAEHQSKITSGVLSCHYGVTHSDERKHRKSLAASSLHIRDIRRARSLCREGFSYVEVASMMPDYVTRVMVGGIHRGKRWEWVI